MAPATRRYGRVRISLLLLMRGRRESNLLVLAQQVNFRSGETELGVRD